jgi:pantoate--beta-alanine ligase
MQLLTTKAEWRAALEEARRRGARVGLVPTMGALHQGHRSLVEAARSQCDVVGVSIFVNPLQFGSTSDLEGYPRELDEDCAQVEEVGGDLVFAPSVREIYPSAPTPPTTSLSVRGAALGLEGADRPGHFDGVATVLAILFGLSGPCRAFFGEKDFQQLCVVRQMVAELSIPVELVGCPTVREDDGLALSSRNRLLSGPGRAAATALWRALCRGVDEVRSGSSPEVVEGAMAACVSQEPRVILSYGVVAEAANLIRPSKLEVGVDYRLLIAGEVDGVRLIDNAACRLGTAP